MSESDDTSNLSPEQQAWLERHDKWREAENINCTSIEELEKIFDKWLYLEPEDKEFIQVGLASLLDREIPGDPVWLFLVAPSGGIKSELIRAFRGYPRAYTLDSLTPHTLISGKTRKNPDTGELEPVAGLLPKLDNKTLLIKDFTTILSSDEGTRSEIYGQLRSAYDGFLEKGFGTLPNPIRFQSSFGLIAGVTPAIDKYTKMSGLLGERFLMIRSSPDRMEASRQAQKNNQKEQQMRHELQKAVSTLIERLDFRNISEYTKQQEEDLIRIGLYIGKMRCGVWANYYQGKIVDMDIVEPEIPTRVTKQLKKLGRLLAILRGHDKIEKSDMDTLKRVARDTSTPKRQRIIDVYHRNGLNKYLDRNDIADRSRGLYHKTVENQLKILTVLDILRYDGEGRYGFTDDFMKILNVVYSTPLITSKASFEPMRGDMYTPDNVDPKVQEILSNAILKAKDNPDVRTFYERMQELGHDTKDVHDIVFTAGTGFYINDENEVCRDDKT